MAYDANPTDPQTYARSAPATYAATSSGYGGAATRSPMVLAGERDERAVPLELGGVREVVPGAGDDDHLEPVLEAQPPRDAGHRDDRHHTGAAGDADRGHVALPDEPAPDRAAQLELVADLGDVVQEAGDLAAGQALDHQLQQRVVGVGRDRVGALRGVAVGRPQADDVVLARQVVDPVLDVEAQPHQAVGGVVDLDDPCRWSSHRRERYLVTDRPGSAARATGRRGRGSRSAPRTRAGRASISSSRVIHFADFQK